MKDIFIWCDCDLDGATSYMLLCWYFERKLPFQATTVKRFSEEYTAWSKTNASKYSKIFIVDLDTSKCDLDVIDTSNVVIIDHHESHKAVYKKATHFIQSSTSCTKLIYKTMSASISDTQKYLILLADDYDSYKLQLEHTYDLNTIFWTYQGNRVEKYYNEFKDGFKGFNNFHKNIILIHNRKLVELKEKLEVYKAFLVIKGKEVKFVSCFASSHINELAEHIINKHNADVGIVVNLKTSNFSLRRSKESSIDLSMLINKIGTGGGHNYAAGGQIDEKFLTFSKLLIPIHEQVSSTTK